MKEIEYQQKMCASAGQIPPLQEQIFEFSALNLGI